jgi:hypothetical protein
MQMATKIGLKEAAGVLGLTSDEVMFQVQSGKLQNSIDEETMSWVFDLSDVLALKESLEEQQQIQEQELLTEE